MMAAPTAMGSAPGRGALGSGLVSDGNLSGEIRGLGAEVSLLLPCKSFLWIKRTREQLDQLFVHPGCQSGLIDLFFPSSPLACP